VEELKQGSRPAGRLLCLTFKGLDTTTEESEMGEEGKSLFLSARFTQAVDYVRHLHIETRKGSKIPAMAHLLGVASLVIGEAGHAPVEVTEDMAIAALLHDAVEDHGGEPRLRDIEHSFGAEVARMVEGMSDTLVEDAGDKEPWEERKARYVKRLETEPLDVQLISAADKLYNVRTIVADYREAGEKIWERFKRGREQQMWYYRELLRVFRTRPTNRIVDEFERAVGELERLIAGRPA
jgi:(p)ppGpp synthase/HD superfamily hydrolase